MQSACPSVRLALNSSPLYWKTLNPPHHTLHCYNLDLNLLGLPPTLHLRVVVLGRRLDGGWELFESEGDFN